MKKTHFFATALALVSIAACSRQETVIISQADTFPVAIEFSRGNVFGIETKASDAPIVDDATLEGKHLAVLSLAWAGAESTPAEDFAAVTALDSPSLLLNGAPAVVNGGIVRFIDGTSFINRYYPQTNDSEPLSYGFYAYRTVPDSMYESEAVPAITEEGTLATSVSLSLTPSLYNADVLWARVERPVAINGVDGYNAEFVRQARKEGVLSANTPAFALTHCAACIHINVKAYGETAEERAQTEASMYAGEGDANDFTISDIALSNLETNLSLDLLTGTLSVDPESASTRENTYYISTDSGSRFEGVVPTAAGSEFGTGTFVLPAAVAAAERPEDAFINMTFVVTDKTGATTTKTAKLLYPVIEEGVSYGFVAGTSYTYNILVKSPEAIVITATVDGFDEGEEQNSTVLG